MAATFILITCLSCLLFYLGTGRQNNGLAFYITWTVVIAYLSYSGFFRQTDQMPPRILLAIVPAIIFVIYCYKKTAASLLKPLVLTSIHILRIPVELTLFRLFIQGKVPVIMTFKGWNFDILIGVSALLILLWSVFSKKKISFRVLRVWNIIGLIFLSVIVITAILSAPSPIQQFAFEHPNLAVMEFPYTLLPATVVPIVLLSHLLELKRM